jgi:outer membrane immunogenic protein
MKLSKSIAGLALAGSMVLGATAALADGLPRYGSIKDAPYVAPFSWTGMYVGLNAGYGWGKNSASLAPSGDPASQAFWNPAFAAGAAPSGFSIDQDGFIGGGQIGYNWQSGTLVYGVEADIQGGSVDGSDAIATNVAPFVPGAFSSSQKLEWLGTIRGRLGLAADKLLVYVTGGFAYGSINHGLNFAFAASNDFHSIGTSNTETGWTLGGGAEWAFANNWTLKAEYLYVDLGDTTLTSTPAGRAANLATTLTERFENQYHIVRAGINYKF